MTDIRSKLSFNSFEWSLKILWRKNVRLKNFVWIPKISILYLTTSFGFILRNLHKLQYSFSIETACGEVDNWLKLY